MRFSLVLLTALLLSACPTATPTGTTGACPASGSITGQPGTLWVDVGQGDFVVFDTQNGKQLKTVPRPASFTSPGTMLGANGILWLTTSTGLTPMQPDGTTLAPISINSGNGPYFGAGKVWMYGLLNPETASEMSEIFSLQSPTQETTLAIANYTANAVAASSDGLYVIGSTLPIGSPLEIVHVDAANSKILWHVSIDAVASVKQSGLPFMAALPGKAFVVSNVGSFSEIFSVDAATGALGTPIKLPFASASNFYNMSIDGSSMYIYSNDDESVSEVDTTTFAAKRTISLKGSVLNSAPIFAGGMWLTVLCGGSTYVRRLDLQSFSLADLALPSAQGSAGVRYAFLPP